MGTRGVHLRALRSLHGLESQIGRPRRHLSFRGAEPASLGPGNSATPNDCWHSFNLFDVKCSGCQRGGSPGAYMTSVLVTIDTELSPAAHLRGKSGSENFDHAILGRVPDGEWGINYQIDQLNSYGVKAVFFVEALSAGVVG